MKHSEALRLAAQRVERGGIPFGCWALQELNICCKDVAAFQLMRPTNRERYGAGHPSAPVADRASWWLVDDDSRIIGLCLAAAIAESEGQ